MPPWVTYANADSLRERHHPLLAGAERPASVEISPRLATGLKAWNQG
jgi:hypothetical protein